MASIADGREWITLFLGEWHGQVVDVRPGCENLHVPVRGLHRGIYAPTGFVDREGRRVFAFAGAAEASIGGTVFGVDRFSRVPESKALVLVECPWGEARHVAEGQAARLLVGEPGQLVEVNGMPYVADSVEVHEGGALAGQEQPQDVAPGDRAVAEVLDAPRDGHDRPVKFREFL
jgi:hypothetical protein